MNGARALLSTLVASGVEVCFTNPGTSEMHFVAALDEVPGMRGVLTLFEGVATGAADGYARIAGKPAATLLHLGPGLANGLANLHNQRRARTPVVTVVGDHATYHHRLDAPLESDIRALAGTVSGWLRTTARADDLAGDAAAAVAAAASSPGQVATLIVPADASWEEAPSGPAAPQPPRPPSPVTDDTLARAAAGLAQPEPAVLFLGGSALRPDALRAAARIAASTGATLLAETFPAVMARGAGLPAVPRLAYFGEAARPQLSSFSRVVLVEAPAPVAFFAYPGQTGSFLPEGCETMVLARPGDDSTGALEALARTLSAGPYTDDLGAPAWRPAPPTGPLTAATIADAVGATLPERAIVVDEANTSGGSLPAATAGAPAHDWLTLTGGAIGSGLPLATGAAVAAPDRPVLCLQADGSAMYTLQALWTQARERLDVTTVIMANRSYAILNIELARVGAKAGGTQAARLLDIGDPDLDFVALAAGMGVPATRVDTAEALVEALTKAFATSGPSLIEAVVAPRPQ